MHYCKGSAKAAIGDCVLLPPAIAYVRARTILEDLFGQKSQVIEAIMNDLLNSPRLTMDHLQGLMTFSIKLRSCEIAISQTSDSSDVDCSANVERVVRYIPSELRRGWARRADEILRQDRRVNLGDLCLFIETEARILNSVYGRLAIRHREFNNSSKPPASRFANNAISASQACSCCKADHKLEECDTFKSLTLQQRWKRVKLASLCFSCFDATHQIKNCPNRGVCQPGCISNLHPLSHLHEDIVGVNSCRVEKPLAVALNTVPVKVVGPKGTLYTYALLDSGSELTIVDETVAMATGAIPSPANITLVTAPGITKSVRERTQLRLCSVDSEDVSVNIEAIILKRLDIKPHKPHLAHELSKWSHLRNLDQKELDDKVVRVLIRADIPMAHWALEQRIAGQNEPYVTRTPFGWCILGPLSGKNRKGTACNKISVAAELIKMYDREFGDLEDHQESLSRDDLRAMSMTEESIRRIGGCYEIALPWKCDPEKLPNNYHAVSKRLKSLLKRFDHDPEFKLKYTKEIRRCIEKGYLVKVPYHQLSKSYPRRWYLPHHAVTHSGKPDKVRIVYDCAAKHNGVSLNDVLLQGPDLTNKLLEVLMKFRQGTVTEAADIEGMFMQVKIPEKDRSMLRVLWKENHDQEPPTEYQLTSHPFGAISSPFCANYALRQTVKDFGKGFPDHIVSSVFENFYVDDCLKALPDVETALNYATGMSEMLSKEGFRLVKWKANKREILDHMCRDGASKGPLEVTSTKVLGIEWWPTEDVFCFRFDFPENPTTKRGILSVIASFYDPIGYVAPVLLPARVALQRICRAKFGWDDELGEEGRQWIQWKENMRKMNPLLVPRGVEPAALKGVEIHSFCDASEMGYGAVVYMMITGSKPCVRLLFAKSRVAPLKVVTIPRLELSAATLAVRITKKVKEIYHLENVPTSYWTDSLIVLYCIQNESKRFSTFVANRLTTIHCLSLARQWNHVPSRDNPADLISRGITCNNQLTKWVEGPDFLRNNGFHPNEQVIITELPNGVELKSCKVQLHSITERRFFEDRFANISDWHLLLRRLAWLVRIKQYFTIMRRGHPSDSLRVGPLTNVEMQLAERDLIRQVQAYHLDESRDGVKRLNPLFLDGLYRVGGRSYGEDGPLILPRGHWTAERIMLYYHKRECHAGPIHVACCERERDFGLWAVWPSLKGSVVDA